MVHSEKYLGRQCRTRKISHLQIKFGLHAILKKFPGIYSLAVPNREDVNVFNIIPGIITSIPQLYIQGYHCANCTVVFI